VLAGAAAAVLVLLTGIAVGLVGRAPECVTPNPGPQQQVTSAPATTTSAAPPADTAPDNQGEGQGSLGDQVGGDRSTGPVEQNAAPAEQAAPVQQVAPAAAEAQCTDGSFAATPALVAVAGAGLTAAVAVALLLAAGMRRPVPTSGPPAAGGPSRPGPGSDPRLDADRAALIRACIYVRDRVTSRALADRLAAALRDAGITVVEPVGDRFDPARHEAGGATPVTDPALTGTIAAVEVPGYVDRTGRVLRAPVVTVYQPGGAGNSTAQQHTAQHTGAIQQPRRRTEEDR
jgi:hypothetical protein